jgi:hypothetical protein
LHLNTYSVDVWRVLPEETLELRVFAEPWFVELAQGQAYVQDFVFLPEPALNVWFVLVQLLHLKCCYSRMAKPRSATAILTGGSANEVRAHHS